MRWARWWRGVGMLVVGLIAMSLTTTARAWQEPEPNEPEGGQVLTQGPIHEAFAEPVLYDPRPSPVVPKAPPAPIAEVPPDQKPEGANVQWIPGYWAWDDSRTDFLWISGTWRAIPPGRQWFPGYWQQVEGGFQWVPGYWSTTGATQVQYLPEPPASLENGPSSPPPAPDATWAPGMWVWQTDQYLWRPGFWVNNQPGWLWAPASYAWTPNGYVYNQGYWDYPLENRGYPFAPVYFSQPTYARPNYRYTPAVGLMTSSLLTSLFVRPASHSYYFGDYYAPSSFQSGIYPAYSFHGSRYGYDPLYAHAAAQNYSRNPRWAEELHETYRYRREHPEARPARTYVEAREAARRPVTGAPLPFAGANALLARPLNQFAARGAGVEAAGVSHPNGGVNPRRFERIDEDQRQDFSRKAAELQQLRESRRRLETESRIASPLPGRREARPVEMPRSPILTAPRPEGRPFATPAAPPHPELGRPLRSAPSVPTRHEPSPEIRPPAPYRAPAIQERREPERREPERKEQERREPKRR